MTRPAARAFLVCLTSLLVFAVAAACSDDGTPTDDAGIDAPDGDTAGTRESFDVAFDAREYGAFMSVWARDGSGVWTVGGQPTLGSPGSGVVFHRDADGWTQLDVESGGMFNWVHGTATSTWVAGELGRVLRFEGTEVTETFQLPTDATLWGLWAAADDDVWTVGGDTRSPDGEPVLAHYDGDEWQLVELPDISDLGANSLFKIWGAADGTLFAVGARGLILTSDGGAWQRMESGTSDDLISLWGRGSSDVVAVGGRAMGVLGRYDGTSWEFRGLDRVSGVNGSWMAADRSVLVDGAGGRILRVAPDSWDFEDLETPTGDMLHGIFALDGGGAWAVGGTLLSPPPFEGVVLQAD